ncbi:hypothetical protein A9B99_10555 [Mangrovibacter phragmitis]|uniref:YaeQ family protein n=1 Tax=Mangrovibacter phragmitis TaxID=1691903 RepID=A0A1B7L316_9ENTR|nr:YaeQ family protein [Mangrovibacter phragmitis]OAT76733.1 hypothetical protein A9B99_10555 [Mangrovibacter phragmitis]
MALKATVYKATVNVADLNRHVYLEHNLTLAQHPSETQERMMLRLLAWIMYASESLHFTRGLCADDEPELWLRNDFGGIELWIDLGLPEEKRLKKANSLSDKVVLFAYNSRAAQVWYEQMRGVINGYADLTVWYLDDQQLAQLTALISRTMSLQATLQEGVIWLSDGSSNLEIQPHQW